MKTTHVSIIVLACCAALAFGACKQKSGIATSSVKSELKASTGGRDLHVVSEGGAWINQQENEFTVKLAGHEILIDRERVLVDKKESAKVPAGAKKFEMSFIAGTLVVGADGAEILKTELKK
jgi:hypothetical protein